VINRDSREMWKKKGAKNTLTRTREIVRKILSEHEPELIPEDIEKEMYEVIKEAAKKYGIKNVPKPP